MFVWIYIFSSCCSIVDYGGESDWPKLWLLVHKISREQRTEHHLIHHRGRMQGQRQIFVRFLSLVACFVVLVPSVNFCELAFPIYVVPTRPCSNLRALPTCRSAWTSGTPSTARRAPWLARVTSSQRSATFRLVCSLFVFFESIGVSIHYEFTQKNGAGRWLFTFSTGVVRRP